MKIRVLALLLVVFSACTESRRAPNILLIVADDLGYSDLGLFGGEIQTPVIDKLGQTGVVYTRFHTAPTCAPSRAMLLSGTDNHTAGMGSQFRRTGEFGYEGYISNRVAIIPQVLKRHGYQSHVVGKWHLGKKPEHNPVNYDFDRSFVLLEGAANHYDSQSLFTDSTSNYREDGHPVYWPEGAYSTKVYSDKLMAYLDESIGQGVPFFAYAAFTSPHWPLQVDSSFWMKYEGKYEAGYEALRQKRLENLKKLGYVDKDHPLPDLHPSVTPWDSLSPDLQRIESRKMELYAGMLDNLDYHIGRLLEYLKRRDVLENTYVIFISDNGAANEDFYYSGVEPGSYHHPYFNNDYENMGAPDSYISYGPQWAEAGSAPYRYHKNLPTEGGTTAPMIISGPNVQQARYTHFVSVQDIAPTIYAMAGIAEVPEFIRGASLYPTLVGGGEAVHDTTHVFVVEQDGNVHLRKGNWKLVHMGLPIQEVTFSLYNISTDPAEQTDLRIQQPAIFESLYQDWLQYQQEVQLITAEPGSKPDS